MPLRVLMLRTGNTVWIVKTPHALGAPMRVLRLTRTAYALGPTLHRSSKSVLLASGMWDV